MKTVITLGLFVSVMLMNSSLSAWSINKTSDGKSCFLASDFVDIKDGYQNTQIQLQVKNNEVVIVSKAPLDHSLNDLGLQVEEGSAKLAASLQKTRSILLKNKKFSESDLQDVLTKKQQHEKEIASIIANKWYKDYKKNPINAKRLDQKMTELETELAVLIQKTTRIDKYLAAKKDEKKILEDYKKVKKYDFIAVDSITDTKNAIIKKSYNKLMGFLSKGEKVRVQLRFWPTWPETKNYDVYIKLADFRRKQKKCLLDK